jgi:Bacterial protein of unknown function (DUF937)
MSLRIRTVLSEAQAGQAYANLARAFHLPPDKVQDAVEDMLEPLIVDIGERLPSRRSLADLVKLLGKNDYERVLESPMLLGATHTQVIGSEALAVIAGRKESNRLAHHAALAAGVSEMITEYLLPAVAAMLIGALARACRSELEELMGHPATDSAATPQTDGSASYDLPRVSGGVGFSGSTGGSASPANFASESKYKDLAEDIRRAGTEAPAEAVRRILAQALDLASGPQGWLRRFGCWGTGAIGAALSSLRR